MEKHEFRRKLILSIVEKGIIAIIVALVGFWINLTLKNRDLQNELVLEREKENSKNIEREFKVFKDSIEDIKELNKIVINSNLIKERDSLLSSLKQTEIDRINDYKILLQNQQNDFERQQEKIQESHEKELVRLKSEYQKTINEDLLRLESQLKNGLENIRSDLEFFNKLDLISLEETGEIWSKVYEYDYYSELLLKSIIDKQGIKRVQLTNRKKEYYKQKKDLEFMLITKRYWLNDSAIDNINSYIRNIDAILRHFNIEKSQRISPKLPTQKEMDAWAIKNELDSLIKEKNKLKQNIYNESSEMRNAL